MRWVRVFSSLLPDLRSGFCLPAPDIPVALDLADVMGEAVHHPLRIDLALSAQTEALEPCRVSNVGEHGLHRPQTPAVTIAALVGVNLALHPLGVGLGFVPVSPQDERYLPRRGLVRRAQTLCTLITRLAVALGAPESNHLVVPVWVRAPFRYKVLPAGH